MERYSEPVYTLNSRGFTMLEVIRDYFQLSEDRMHNELHAMHVELRKILDSKGIPYQSLKSALVPHTDRHEAGFIFDSEATGSNWHGRDVATRMLPLFDKRGSRSILCGDLLGDDYQDLILEILQKHMEVARPFEFTYSSQLYCVYVNNLTRAALAKIDGALQQYSAYLGYIPTTYGGVARTYLSTTLCNAYLMRRNKVLMGHEDDVPNNENTNMLGYPFEENGFEVISLQSMYFSLFLSYKVEREVAPGFEVDTEMALNTISQQVISLEQCDIRIDPEKLAYLQSEKGGKLGKAGLGSADADAIAKVIRQKIAASYIYNLAYLEEHNVAKFNIIVEIPHQSGGHPTRVLAALEYLPDSKTLRLITLT